jgi:CRISPR-associated endonuclease/helicase Cas3
VTSVDLPPLGVSEFKDFFAALWTPHDRAEPVVAFDWQRDLVARLARERKWPELIDLPTGSGKTSLLDIALFLQALDAERDPAERWMPRRIVLVVDRRVVVDQADDRGRKIAERLVTASAANDVLARVATRLRHLSGAGEDEPPITTGVLRGGIVRDESWAERPDRPALISSTVDQVGSRLLLRGYGISASMRPVHAGLLAHDCLLLLDEVHLARPFAETLSAVGSHRRRAARASVAQTGRWHVVELSATPTRATGMRFPQGRLEPGTHPVLRRRLLASKPALLTSVVLPSRAAAADRAFVDACAKAARDVLDGSDVTALGVIVNRVSSARDIAKQLVEDLAGDGTTDVVLLTGRMRPVERDQILDDYRDRLEMGRERAVDARRLVVVATQSIEAGADFDLDAIVTECASLDALRQRFGRVDRDGLRSDAGTEVTSVVLAREHAVTARAAPDPVYGHALARTWAWLEGIADRSGPAERGPIVDFGIRALPDLDDDALEQLVPPAKHAPVLLPAHLDAWVQTNPAPTVEPDVSRWLHGIRDVEHDVRVVWRDDIDESLLDPEDLTRASIAIDRVRARPPLSTEAMSLPIAAVRRWLWDEDPSDVTDVEGVVAPEDDWRASRRPGAVVRWAGAESRVIAAEDIRPDDTLVVPAMFGGIYLGSWAPTATEACRDLGEIAMRQQRRLVVLRLYPEDWPRPFAEFRIAWDDATARERRELVHGAVRAMYAACQPGTRRDDLGTVLAATRRLLHVRVLDEILDLEGNALPAPPNHQASTNPYGPTVVVTAPANEARGGVPLPLALAGDGDGMSFSGRADLTLAAHMSGVARWVAGFCERLGIDPEVSADLGLAARLHDLGKADERFQRWLHDGDEHAVAGAAEPLAKSRTPHYDASAREAARQASGYPRGARHELTSVSMVELADSLLRFAHDRDLVLHLIASHHGYCRGFAPLVDDPRPVTMTYEHDGAMLRASSAHGLERVDSGIAERFWRVVERYGWFGLAWLEAILRLADHRRSEEESWIGNGA